MIAKLKNTKLIFFKLPKKSNILLYDNWKSFYVKKIFNEINYPFIFDYTNRKIIFLFFLLIFLKIKTIKILIKDNLITAYTFNFINYVDPKIVLTTTDNNINFYRLKKYFKNTKFVSIQNGNRHIINDLFGNPLLIKSQNSKKKFSCDMIYTLNQIVGKLYQKYIDTKTFSIGSFRNNLMPNSINFKKNTILYISQFRVAFLKEGNPYVKTFLNQKYYCNHGNKVTTIKKWFAAERKLLPLLAKYCEKKNLKLTICGSSRTASGIKIEKKVFNKMIKSSNWIYWNNKKKPLDVYRFADKFELIVCIWSTLGLELFGRNKKVAFFRQNIKGYPDRDFGWPLKLKKKGFFYTSEINDNEVNRILNSLRNIKTHDWISKINIIKKKIMDYDYNNEKLKNSLKKLYE